MSVAIRGIDLPMRISLDEPLSIEAFWAFSAENPDLRLEREPNGDVVLMSPILGGAGVRSSYAFGKLFAWSEQDGTGWAIDSSTGCLLSDGSVRSADAAWIRKSRWTPPSVDDDAPVLCPDFVIELRSKSDRLSTLRDKMGVWIANGCQLAWLIDPRRQAVEVYKADGSVEVQEGRSTAQGEEPVGSFVLELTRIWG